MNISIKSLTTTPSFLLTVSSKSSLMIDFPVSISKMTQAPLLYPATRCVESSYTQSTEVGTSPLRALLMPSKTELSAAAEKVRRRGEECARGFHSLTAPSAAQESSWPRVPWYDRPQTQSVWPERPVEQTFLHIFKERGGRTFQLASNLLSTVNQQSLSLSLYLREWWQAPKGRMRRRGRCWDWACSTRVLWNLDRQRRYNRRPAPLQGWARRRGAPWMYIPVRRPKM